MSDDWNTCNCGKPAHHHLIRGNEKREYFHLCDDCYEKFLVANKIVFIPDLPRTNTLTPEALELIRKIGKLPHWLG